MPNFYAEYIIREVLRESMMIRAEWNTSPTNICPWYLFISC